ncbi:hypothetical protein P3S68_007655 [Capsicum galapagoense]
MTCKEGVGFDSEEEKNQLISQELASMEEIKLLKQQIAEMYQAWLNGQAPPSSIPGLLNTNDPNSAQAQTGDPFYPPGFCLFANESVVAGTFTMRPPNPSVTNDPLFTFVAPVTVGLQSTVPKNTGEPSHDQLYPPEMIFKPQNPHYHAHQHDSPIVIEKIVKNEEQEEMDRKIRILEQSLRNMQGLGGQKSISYKDLCMFPDVHLLLRFKMPKFDKYEVYGDLVAHLKRFCNQLRGARGKEKLLMTYFGESLTGIEQASRVRPSIKESEMIDIFLQTQEPDYFHHSLSTIGSTFAEVIKVGEMVENGIKSGKIISQAALKATTQAIQSGSRSFGENKRKDDVVTVVPGLRQNWRCARQPYTQNPLYFISSPQYPSYNAQPYARTLFYSQWHAPTTQNHLPTPPTYPSPSIFDFCSKPNNEKKQKLRDNFTLIRESYTSLFQKLRQKDMITLLLGYTHDPHSRNFDTNVRYVYHSDVQGHSTEDYCALKREIERMIQDKLIMMQDVDSGEGSSNANVRTGEDIKLNN